MSYVGPNGGGILRWILDNIPALVAALSAAGLILSRYQRRNFWVWLFAVSAFVYTFLSEATKQTSSDYDSKVESEGLSQEGR